MKRNIIFIVLALTSSHTYVRSQNTEESPCPQVFTYESTTESDKWYGNVRVRPEVTLYGFWIDIILDGRAESIGNWLGDVSTPNEIDFKIENTRLILHAYTTTSVRFYVKYDPGLRTPRVKFIRLNGQQICAAPAQNTNVNIYNNNNNNNNRSSAETSRNSGALPLHSRDSSYNSSRNGQEADRRTPATNSHRAPTNTDYGYNTGSNTDRDTSNGENNRNTPQDIGSSYNNNNNNDRQTFGRQPSTHRDASTQIFETTTKILYPSYDSADRIDSQTRRPTFNSENNGGNVRPVIQDSFGYSIETARRNTPSTTTQRSRENDYSDDRTVGNNNKKKKDRSNDYFEGDFRITDSSRITPTPLPRPRESDNRGTRNRETDNNCGKVSAKPRPLIVGGQEANEGQWPWHVAIYQTQTVDSKYICGGSLVTSSHVLTAAHCVARKSSSRKVNPQTLTVYLGKYNLRKSTDSVQIMLVRDIHIHPQYNSSNFYADLAVLKFTKPSEFTLYVRPVCLWKESETELSNIIDKEGTVVGWGFDEEGEVTEELTLVRMPVVKQSTCLWSFKEFYTHFTSEQSYCAGYENGTSVCNGDSGGGMVFPEIDSDNSPTWRLRGLVSIGVAKQYDYKCDPYHYVVFTDTAQFLSWIKERIAE